MDHFKFYEAFNVVGCANTKLLVLDALKINIHGGAVALGHRGAVAVRTTL